MNTEYFRNDSQLGEYKMWEMVEENGNAPLPLKVSAKR